MVTEAQIDTLRAALEPVYDTLREATYFHGRQTYTLSDEEKGAPWKLPLCDKWARLALPVAQQALSGGSIEVQLRHIACNPSMEAEAAYRLRRSTYHEYLVEESDMADPLVIDGTWQQFAPVRCATNAPPILIARASETPALLSQAGVDPRLLYAWRVDPGFWCRQATRPPYEIFRNSIFV